MIEDKENSKKLLAVAARLHIRYDSPLKELLRNLQARRVLVHLPGEGYALAPPTVGEPEREPS